MAIEKKRDTEKFENIMTPHATAVAQGVKSVKSENGAKRGIKQTGFPRARE
jgi:hypothetical protein